MTMNKRNYVAFIQIPTHTNTHKQAFRFCWYENTTHAWSHFTPSDREKVKRQKKTTTTTKKKKRQNMNGA